VVVAVGAAVPLQGSGRLCGCVVDPVVGPEKVRIGALTRTSVEVAGAGPLEFCPSSCPSSSSVQLPFLRRAPARTWRTAHLSPASASAFRPASAFSLRWPFSSQFRAVPSFGQKGVLFEPFLLLEPALLHRVLRPGGVPVQLLLLALRQFYFLGQGLLFVQAGLFLCLPLPLGRQLSWLLFSQLCWILLGRLFLLERRIFSFWMDCRGFRRSVWYCRLYLASLLLWISSCCLVVCHGQGHRPSASWRAFLESFPRRRRGICALCLH